MSILYAGTSLADAVPSDIANVGADVTAAYLSPNVSEGIVLGLAYPLYFDTKEVDPTLTFGFSTYAIWRGTSFTNNTSLWEFLAEDGRVLFDVRITTGSSTTTLALRAYNGSTMATLATSAGTVTVASLVRADVFIDIHDTTGKFELYINGVLFVSFSGDTNLFASTGIVKARSHRHNSVLNASSHAYYSAFFVADELTTAMTFVQRKPTGNGFNTAWSGDYTSVDETGYSDSDRISSATTGAIETFTKGSLDSLGYDDTYEVAALVTAIRGFGSIDGAFRIGGTNYDGPSFNASGVTGPYQSISTQNPATTAAWLPSEIDAAEIGVKVAA